MNQIIRLENVTKIFGKDPNKAVPFLDTSLTRDEIFQKTGQFVALNNVSLSIRPGEICVIMGLSGSGKSTLLRCMNRLIAPTFGKVNIEDIDITCVKDCALRKIRREKFSMVFQNFALFPHKTILQNVEYGLEIMGLSKSARKNKALSSLQLVGLEEWIDLYPAQLSGGMKQRVGLSRALANDPEILLMDEAFSALDPLNRKDMQDELLTIHRKMKKTIVFISHDLDEAIRLADYILILNEGKIVQRGTPEEILTNPSTKFVQRFVEDYDMTKIISASSIMKQNRAVAFLNQGPRVALHKMDREDMNTIFVLDDDHKLIGYVYDEDCVRAIKRNENHLHNILHSDHISARYDHSLQELLTLSLKTTKPIAVIDEQIFLKGVITKSHLLSFLEEVNDTHADT